MAVKISFTNQYVDNRLYNNILISNLDRSLNVDIHLTILNINNKSIINIKPKVDNNNNIVITIIFS